ncbi:peptidyl-prolyl cis-trans isomerase [Neobacillus sp. SM06]|uniref:peptidyl-prolyl cis-trans isomerase n=1 Tax=Neobacillus sp. SM06 TaxID=3422492 RepID=UPI003D2B3C11
MDKILLITGNVKYTITLDPGVWIFDDRKIDLLTYFETQQDATDELEAYTKSISKHWDREIIEGAIYPPTLKSEKKYEKEKLLTGSFAMPFKPFLENAEPNEDAKSLVIECLDKQVEMPFKTAHELILGFSDNGKPLGADGPVHIYYGDGSNRHQPIKNVKAFIIK